jgi:hypothetical protein
MRQLSWILGLLCASIGAAAADAASRPDANVPDHVVTMVRHPGYGTEDHMLTIMHHGDWTRTDTIVAKQKTTTYVRHGSATEISVSPDGPDYFYAAFTSPDTDRIGDTSAFKTDERRTVLGESCVVWNVLRVREPRPGGGGIEKLSCVTDDGIELSYAFVGRLSTISSAEATHIERRSVEPNDVRPSPRLLALDWWDQVESAPATTPPTPDYETVMRPEGHPVNGPQFVRTMRHHHPWTYVEDWQAGVLRRLTISHPSTEIPPFDYRDYGEQKHLIINRWRPGTGSPAPSTKPQDENREEIVLGESCRWFDLTPGMMDYGLHECRTKDHIVLKEEEVRWGSGRTITAVRLVRRSVDPRELRPPAAILGQTFWGLE